jgi:hypothetical protein
MMVSLVTHTAAAGWGPGLGPGPTPARDADSEAGGRGTEPVSRSGERSASELEQARPGSGSLAS